MRRRGRSSGIVGRLAALWLLLVTIAALGAPHWAPYPPDAQDLEGRYGSPSAAHWLGQDHLGRDVFSRLLYGARVSLLVGGVTVVLSVGIGLVFGLAAGYYGGWVDQVVMRFIDILMAFPGILLAIALAAVLGPSLRNVIVALSVIGWVGYARLVRGQTLVVKEMEFVAAARALGATDLRLIVLHIVPNILPPLSVQATFGMAAAILGEAGLSFLGLGVQTIPSWGAMLSEGATYYALHDAPHVATFAGLAIMLVVLSLNLLGDALRDRLDPKGGGG